VLLLAEKCLRVVERLVRKVVRVRDYILGKDTIHIHIDEGDVHRVLQARGETRLTGEYAIRSGGNLILSKATEKRDLSQTEVPRYQENEREVNINGSRSN
jgi:hypothetical protein